MQITKEIEWDMGHRIPNHKSKCRNLHGYRYKTEVCFEGLLIQEKGSSSEDMFIDFQDVKQILIEEIEEVCDHGFMIYKKDSILVDFFNKNKDFKHIIVPFIPTAEQISKWIFDKLEKRYIDVYGKNLTLSSVRLWETPTSIHIHGIQIKKNFGQRAKTGQSKKQNKKSKKHGNQKILILKNFLLLQVESHYSKKIGLTN